MTDLEKLKLLLGKEDASQDGVLLFVLETVEEQIKNYCNVEEVPPQLENTRLRMAAGLYRLEGYGQETGPGAVQSVTRGDVTVNFGAGSREAQAAGAGKSILDDYRSQLQAFRKLRW